MITFYRTGTIQKRWMTFIAFALGTLGFAICTASAKDFPRTQDLHAKGGEHYFTTAGRRLAKKFHVDPPPVRLSNPEKVNPPRNVASQRWNAPFCKVWSDGCRTCTRDDAGRTSCEARDAPACTRHSVQCTVSSPDSRNCQREDYELHRELKGGQTEMVNDTSYTSWTWQRGHWTVSGGSTGVWPTREFLNDPNVLRTWINISCFPYQRSQASTDFFIEKN